MYMIPPTSQLRSGREGKEWDRMGRWMAKNAKMAIFSLKVHFLKESLLQNTLRNVSAVEVLHNCALRIDIYWFTYLLTKLFVWKASAAKLYSIHWPIYRCKDGGGDAPFYVKIWPKLTHRLQKFRFPINISS